MEPTRIELDLPVAIYNKYGKLEMPNHKAIDDVLAQYFDKGTVVSLHIIIESTPEHRDFCKHVDPNSTYKSECGQILNTDGTCWFDHIHAEADAKWLTAIQAANEEQAEAE